MFGIKKQFMLAACIVVATALSSWANVPAPPVNQILGIPDTTFNNLTEEECRACHEDPNITGPISNVNRHHLLVNEPLADPTVAPNVLPGETTYQCLACHPTEWNGSEFVISVIRNCTECHKQTGGNTVHHATSTAQGGDCVACHGSLVDNMDDGHYIPTYEPSLVTPWPSGKDIAGPNGEGACTYCHAAGIDVMSGVDVKTSNANHHSTGFGDDLTKCFWCHDPLAAASELIRRCEGCHGPSSLHNIQVDSPAAANIGTIEPGLEDPYWGHIGNNDDCFGCHGFTALSAAAPYSGPVAPGIAMLSAVSVTEGTAAEITASGSAFTNIVTGPSGAIDLNSSVELTAADGTTYLFEPSALSVNSLTVTLPADLPPGNYDFRAVKINKYSNPVNFSVLPLMDVQRIVCRGKGVTITGTGFSQYLDAVDSGTSLTAADRNGGVDCTVKTWKDNKITATCSACPTRIDVESIWGEEGGRPRSMRSRR